MRWTNNDPGIGAPGCMRSHQQLSLVARPARRSPPWLNGSAFACPLGTSMKQPPCERTVCMPLRSSSSNCGAGARSCVSSDAAGGAARRWASVRGVPASRARSSPGVKVSRRGALAESADGGALAPDAAAVALNAVAAGGAGIGVRATGTTSGRSACMAFDRGTGNDKFEGGDMGSNCGQTVVRGSSPGTSRRALSKTSSSAPWTARPTTTTNARQRRVCGNQAVRAPQRSFIACDRAQPRGLPALPDDRSPGANPEVECLDGGVGSKHLGAQRSDSQERGADRCYASRMDGPADRPAASNELAAFQTLRAPLMAVFTWLD